MHRHTSDDMGSRRRNRPGRRWSGAAVAALRHAGFAGCPGIAGVAAFAAAGGHRRLPRVPRRDRAPPRLARSRHRWCRVQAGRLQCARNRRTGITSPALGARIQVPGAGGIDPCGRHRRAGRPYRRSHSCRAAGAGRRRRGDGHECDAAQPGRDRPQGRPGRGYGVGAPSRRRDSRGNPGRPRTPSGGDRAVSASGALSGVRLRGDEGRGGGGVAVHRRAGLPRPAQAGDTPFREPARPRHRRPGREDRRSARRARDGVDSRRCVRPRRRRPR